MRWQEYLQKAARTAGTFESKRMALAYWTLGIVGEIDEFSEAYVSKDDCGKEAGDVLWYVALMQRESEAEVSFHRFPPGSRDAGIQAARLAEHVKKNLGHGKPLDIAYVSELLSGIAQSIVEDINACNLTLEQVLEANIKKLEERYPHGFSVQASLNRPEYQGERGEQPIDNTADGMDPSGWNIRD